MAAEILHELQLQHTTPQKALQNQDIDIDVTSTEKPPQQNNSLDHPKKKFALERCNPGPPASRPRTPQDIVENRAEGKLDISSSELSIGDFELLQTLGTGKQGVQEDCNIMSNLYLLVGLLWCVSCTWMLITYIHME